MIVPALDEGRGIASLLRDLQPLREAGGELILVDGGSRDDTVARAAPWVDRVLEGPPGRARQMNLGAAAAGGDLLWFLHADSRVDGALLQALRGLGPVPWGRVDVRLDDPAPLFRLIEALMNRRSCLTGMATGDQGIFVQRELFEAVGGYPELPLMEDLALSRRLRREARPHCLRGPLVTSARRWRRHGVVRTVLLMWGLRLAYALGVPARRLARYYRRCTPTSAS